MHRHKGHEHNAEAIISMPDSITDPQKAIDEATAYLTPYQRLLAFAHGIDVIFHNFNCYQIQNGNEKWVAGSTSSIRVGDWQGTGKVVEDISDFLAVAMPLLRDNEYTNKTGINQALVSFNEANNHLLTIEMKLSVFFIGLETLATVYHELVRQPYAKTSLIDDENWSALQDYLDQIADDLGIDNTIKNLLMSRFGELNYVKPNKEPGTDERIINLCKSHGLPEYRKEISAMYLMRNDILHGKPMAAKYNDIESVLVMRCAWLLLQKLILKNLDYYRPLKVAVEITDNNLL
jgi:hypothetical protein